MTQNSCWCGNNNFVPFGPAYGECRVCGTLVSLKGLSNDQLRVINDERDFYGKEYWLKHQETDLGFPDIYIRARKDLTERNLHWLSVLLKYRLPPANTMELGCAHGSFVALMKQAGYHASGIEMSPWVVAFGKDAFGIDLNVGPVESLKLDGQSLDVIVLMDVLEHLPDPDSTMRRCFELLKPDGLVLIQTPRYREETSYTTLVESIDPFLQMLKTDEHLYLFSNRSITYLFRSLGAEHICFEPAIFAQYDMFFAVSRASLQANTPDEIESALLSTPNGRITLALLDLFRKWEESEADRAARLEQIVELTKLLKESEADRAARLEQIVELTRVVEDKRWWRLPARWRKRIRNG